MMLGVDANGLQVFGMIRAIQHMDTYSDLREHGTIVPWFDAMKAAVEQ